MNPEDKPDEIAELADRLQAKQRRGEELGIEFEIDFASLTDAERDEFLALMKQRIAHGEERLGALEENVRALEAIHAPVQSSGAPPGTTLGQALVRNSQDLWIGVSRDLLITTL